MKIPLPIMTWGSVAAFALLIYAGGFALNWEIHEALDASTSIAYSFELQTTLERMHAALRAAQSGVRGYVIAGTDSALEDYRTAAHYVNARLPDLHAHTLDQPQYHESLSHLEEVIRGGFHNAESVIDVRRSEGFEAASRMLLGAEHAPLQPALRKVEYMAAHEQGILSQRRLAVQGKMRELTWALLSAAIVVLGLQTYVILLVQRDQHRRNASQMQLKSANERLESCVQERTATLATANKELTALSRQVLQVQEQERRALALELHDQIGQQLAAIKLNLHSIEHQLDQATHADAAERTRDCIEIAQNTYDQIHDLALNLRPSVLDKLGLIPALEWYAYHQSRRADCVITVAHDALPKSLPAEVVTASFRVVQEAVSNALRHAHPQSIAITVHRHPDSLTLSIRDDGAGFDVTQFEMRQYNGAGFGLLGMRERVTLAGGLFTVRSKLGAGTEVSAEMPLTNEQRSYPSESGGNAHTPHRLQ